MIRTIAIYATLAVGLVLMFAGLFAILALAWFLAGTAALVVSFLGIIGTLVAGLCALFINEREEVEGDDLDQWTAHEGAQVVQFPERAS